VLSNNTKTWLGYEPEVVELQGRLILVQKYGPPNYGENPETDSKVKVPVLQLSQPINVRRDPNSNMNTRSFVDVKEVQLVFLTEKNISYRHLVGKVVTAKGTLFQGHTGHHYTEVLLVVNAIGEK
jgi:hypothetical protein